MRNYILTLLLSAKFKEAKVKEILEKIEKSIEKESGKVVKSKDLGKIDLAYKIKKEDQAFCFVLNLSLDATKAGGINSDLERDEEILRHLLTKHETRISKPERFRLDRHSEKKKVGEK